MLRCILLLTLFFTAALGQAQQLRWSTLLDTVKLYGSPRCADLNGDSVLDVVVGAGAEQAGSGNGVVAINGTDGSLLWRQPANDQVFGSALFRDVTGDAVPDVFIGGRTAGFWALNGTNGHVLWQFWPDTTAAADSGYYNFYLPQWVPDADGDQHPDLLLTNGGDAAATPLDTMRPPGKLLVLSSANGAVLTEHEMPDGKETYCSPLLFGPNRSRVLVGSGGESIRGNYFEVGLADFWASGFADAVALASDSAKGFVVPPSFGPLTADTVPDIVLPVLNGRVLAFDGSTRALLWTYSAPGYESYVSPTLGNFTNDSTADVFVVQAKGVWPFYSHYVALLLDGGSGAILWSDTTSKYALTQANALDWDGDGLDEVLRIVNRDAGFAMVEFENQFYVTDFQSGSSTAFGTARDGLNLFSTPTIVDLEGDGTLEIVYGYNTNTQQWSTNNGARIECMQLPAWDAAPAWPGYLGANSDGYFQEAPISVGINVSSALQLNVWPNPATHTLFAKPLVGSAFYAAYNTLGQRIDAGTTRGEINCSNWPPGLYVLRIEQRNRITAVRVVKK